MNPSAPALAFVGTSNSGKTTLIERLLPRLREAGLRVAVVKHTHHLVDWDGAGKDSWRFREAGANRVVLATPELLMSESRMSLNESPGLLSDIDLVIHEGQRASSLPKILVGESEHSARARGTAGEVIACVGCRPAAEGVPVFDRDDIEGLLRFILGRRSRPQSAPSFDDLLDAAVKQHGHLCPGQVLGVRMTLRGLAELDMPVPPPAKSLIAIVETDRCAADAVATVSGCSLGRRTLKHFNFGKMAASFLDLRTGAAVRVTAREDARDHAASYAPGFEDPHRAQTQAYRLMPDHELLTVQSIEVRLSEADMPGRPRQRVVCARCGEAVSDAREVWMAGQAWCRACAGQSYYSVSP
jgi:formylmethanofuran dehydrogenase subunit E